MPDWSPTLSCATVFFPIVDGMAERGMADRDRLDREARSVRNERGAAILLAANVENGLRYAITRRGSILGRVDNEELFSYDRPMGSFQHKIRMAYALGIIGNETKENLGIIRRVRNTFAHAASPVSFSTNCVHQACDLLAVPANYRPSRRKTLSGRVSVHGRGGVSSQSAVRAAV